MGGFKPIQGDYIEKPTGITAEDLLKWDGSTFARFAKGVDGQYLKTASGALNWAEAAKDLYFYTHGSSFFEKDTITSADEITLTSFNGVKTLETLTLDGSFSSICQNGFGYKISFTDEAKQASTTFTASRRYIHATLDADYTGGTCYTTATNAVPTTSYTPNLEAPKTPTSIIPYNNTVYFNTKTTGATPSTFYSRNRIYTIYKVLPASVFTLSGLTEYSGIRYIELFDAGDGVKLNNDDNLVFTGIAGQPLEINVSTNRYMFGQDIDYDGITSIEIVSGNPLIVFEKA